MIRYGLLSEQRNHLRAALRLALTTPGMITGRGIAEKILADIDDQDKSLPVRDGGNQSTVGTKSCHPGKSGQEGETIND